MAASTADQSTAAPEQQRHLTVTFKRKVNLEALGAPKYESAELFFAVDDYVPLDANTEDIVAEFRNMASMVKATVLDESGLEWEVTEDGVVIERFRSAFGPGVQVEGGSTSGAQAQPQASAPASDVPSAPPYAGQKLDFKADKAKVAEQREWAVQRFLVARGEFWDNRETKPKQTSPDFRHKEHGVSIWVSDIEKAGGTV